MSPLSNATTLANYASGIGTQGATLEVDSNNKRVGIGTTNPQGPEGSLQVGTAVTISGNSGIVSATTFHGDFGSSTSVAGDLTVSGVITYEDVTNIDSIGIMTARSDLSIADKIIHTGDTNTAIRFPAADTVTVETGGSERLRVNSSGEVSIGTVTGGKTLTLFGTSSSSFRISKSGVLAYDHTFDGSSYTIANNNGSAGIPLIIGTKTAGAESLRIDSSGRVLIGTTTEGAADADNLTIADSGDCGITIRTGTTSTGSIYFSDATSGASEADGFIDYNQSSRYLRFATAQSERMRIDSSGRMGLGTNSPLANLQVGGYSSSQGISIAAGTGSYSYLYFADGSSGNQQYRGYIQYNHATDILEIGTSGSEALRIDSSGRMGLGTASPSTTLHLSGSADTYLTLQAGTTDGNDAILFKNSAGTQKGAFLYDTDDNYLLFNVNESERMRIDSSGRMGLGTNSPSSLLHVSGQDTTVNISASTGSLSAMTNNTSQKIGFQGGNAEIGLFKDSSANYSYVVGTYQGSIDIPLVFRTGNRAERMRITPSGNLGINNNNPSQRVHVGGNIEFNAHDSTSGNGGYYTSKGLIIGNAYDAGKGSSVTDDRNAIIWQERGLDLDFATNNAVRMTLNYNGGLLIGTSTASGLSDRLLTVGKGNRAASYLEIRNSSTGVGGLLFSDGTTGDAGYRGQVDYAHSIDEMRLWTAALPRLRIQGDGTLRFQPAGATSSANLVIDRSGTTIRFKSQIDGSGGAELSMQTQSGGAVSERGRFTSVGLEFPSGLGISFGPTSDASGMSSEILDDYEEGTWTPVVYGSSTNGTASYSYQNARYTKIGRKVHIECYVNFSSHTGTGALYLYGLPYTVNNGTIYGGPAINYWHQVTVSNGASPHAIFANNNTYIYFYQQLAGQASSISMVTAGGIILSGSYSI